jgi:hypothetical protein
MAEKTISGLLIVSLYLKQFPIQKKPGTFQEVKAAFLGCLSNTTGHGLPQIVKPGNPFLNVLWVMFYAVAVSGCGFLIYQAVEQFCQFDVITMTKIMRGTEMTFPGITICSEYTNTYDMIIECRGPSGKECKIKYLTLYDRGGQRRFCVQINDTELLNAYSEGTGNKYSYYLDLYKYEYANLYVAFTDNSAHVVREEVIEEVNFGQITKFVLSKTVQTVLGPPHSNCNQSSDYRQANCVEDCDKKAIIEKCGFGYDIGTYDNDIETYDNDIGTFEYDIGTYVYDDRKISEKCREVLYGPTKIIIKCYQECPVECKQVSFQSKRVDVEWDLENHDLGLFKSISADKFNYNISKYSDDEFKKRITRLFIYFDKLETTVITQSPSISLTSLIANVGGLLGKLLQSLCIFKIHLTYLIAYFFNRPVSWLQSSFFD